MQTLETRPTIHPILGPYDAPAYAWYITRDFISKEGESDYSVGSAGPRWATDEDIERAKTEGREFRMLDDDGIVYYHGKVWYSENVNEDDGNPLDDFGTPNAGAVTLQYKENGEWKSVI